MEAYITDLFKNVLAGYSLLAVALIFLGGVITSIGPCNLSMVPIMMAYVGGNEILEKRRGFLLSAFFTLGTSTTFVGLGVFAALVGGIFGPLKSYLTYFVAAVCILVALRMLDVLHFDFKFVSAKYLTKPKRSGVIGSYLLGLTVGLAGSQCGTPILLIVLSLVMAKGQLLYGAILLFFYGLGRGIPVIIAGTFIGIFKQMPLISVWSQRIQKFSGVVLLFMGFYLLLTA